MLKQLIRKLTNILGYDIIRYKKKHLWHFETIPPQTYYEIDERFHENYDNAQHHTQMTESDNSLRRLRHYALWQLIQRAEISQGAVCEIGCFRGLSAYQIANFILQSKKNVEFHIFDSFEGLSGLDDVDIPKDRNQNLDQLRKQFACSLDTVKNNLKKFPFIEYYKGWIPERFSEVKNKTFSFVHIDVDLYQPIYDSFQFFYPKLIKNGIMVFDDYGSTQFPGAKKAIDECVKSNTDFIMPLPSGEAFLIKK